MRRGLCNGSVSVRPSRLEQRAAGCCCGPGGQAISIDSGGRPAATAPHSSTAASSKCGQCHVVAIVESARTGLTVSYTTATRAGLGQLVQKTGWKQTYRRTRPTALINFLANAAGHKMSEVTWQESASSPPHNCHHFAVANALARRWPSEQCAMLHSSATAASVTTEDHVSFLKSAFRSVVSTQRDCNFRGDGVKAPMPKQ